MANTFSQIYVQLVFAVKFRARLIPSIHREEIHKYISGIIKNRNQKLLAIFCMPDHIHILLRLQPTVSISDLTREIKALSSKFINEKNWIDTQFNWQEGYGAFSYSTREIEIIIQYILNQEIHHKRKSFKEEYIQLLNDFEIQFDEKYLFDWRD